MNWGRPSLYLNKTNLNIGLWVPAAFAHSMPKIDALTGVTGGSPSEVSEKKNPVIIKELRSIDIT